MREQRGEGGVVRKKGKEGHSTRAEKGDEEEDD